MKEGSKVVASFIISKHTVASNTRHSAKIQEILDRKLPDAETNQLLACSALACTLKDTDGNLVYPEASGAETIYNEMDADEYTFLCEAYIEVNPLSPSLKAKKKKY